MVLAYNTFSTPLHCIQISWLRVLHRQARGHVQRKMFSEWTLFVCLAVRWKVCPITSPRRLTLTQRSISSLTWLVKKNKIKIIYFLALSSESCFNSQCCKAVHPFIGTHKCRNKELLCKPSRSASLNAHMIFLNSLIKSISHCYIITILMGNQIEFKLFLYESFPVVIEVQIYIFFFSSLPLFSLSFFSSLSLFLFPSFFLIILIFLIMLSFTFFFFFWKPYYAIIIDGNNYSIAAQMWLLLESCIVLL